MTTAFGRPKDRRSSKRLPPEHDFSVTAIGSAVILVVILLAATV